MSDKAIFDNWLFLKTKIYFIAQNSFKSTTKSQALVTKENALVLPKINEANINEGLSKKVANLNKLILNFEKQFNEQMTDIMNDYGKIKALKSKAEIAFRQQIETISNSVRNSSSKFKEFLNSLRDFDVKKTNLTLFW